MRPIENLRRCNTLEFSGFDQSWWRAARVGDRLRLWSLAKTGASAKRIGSFHFRPIC